MWWGMYAVANAGALTTLRFKSFGWGWSGHTKTATHMLDIRQIKKEIPGTHYFSFFTLSNLLTQTCLPVYIFARQSSSLLLNMQTVHLLFIIRFVCLYFDAVKFSKLFSLIYFTVSVVRQRDDYEIVTETRPIKTRLHNQLSLPRC